MNRIELRLTDHALVRREDGLLDMIEVSDRGLTIALVVGPAGAHAAAEAGAHLLAAARRQHIPATVITDSTVVSSAHDADHKTPPAPAHRIRTKESTLW